MVFDENDIKKWRRSTDEVAMLHEMIGEVVYRAHEVPGGPKMVALRDLLKKAEAEKSAFILRLFSLLQIQ